jgi:hypothetical protein
MAGPGTGAGGGGDGHLQALGPSKEPSFSFGLRQVLSYIARHVSDNHFESSFLP